MNRLILIGNGFDLAYNLETKYSQFIGELWLNKLDVFINAINNNNLVRTPDYDIPNYDTFMYDDNEIKVIVKDYERISKRLGIIENETAFQTFNTYISNFSPLAHQVNYRFNFLIGYNLEISVNFVFMGLLACHSMPKDKHMKLLNYAGLLTWEYIWWSRQNPWLIFAFGYLTFFTIAIVVHDMEKYKNKFITLGVLYGVDLLLLVIFGCIGWM